MEAHSEPDHGARCVALSAALHAAVFGVVLLAPPGSDAFAMDDLFAPRPRVVVASVLAARESTPVFAATSSAISTTPIVTPSRPRRGARTHAHRASHVDSGALLAAIAGQLSATSANAPSFVAANELAARGEGLDAATSNGFDMRGVGRGSGDGGGDTIGAEISNVMSAGTHGVSCTSEELIVRTALIGRIAAVASCSAGRNSGLIGVGTLNGRSGASAPDAIDGGPRRPMFGCGGCEGPGALSRDAIRRVVARHRAEIRSCYERALNTRPELEGRVTVSWSIALSGAVQGASIDAARSDLHAADVEQCVASAVARWSFPRAGRSSVVSYPFVLGRDP